jgi:hypothetical protein
VGSDLIPHATFIVAGVDDMWRRPPVRKGDVRPPARVE